MASYSPGTALIKREFLIHHIEQPSAYDDDAAEGSKRPPSGRADDGETNETKKQRKAQRGQNKGRKFGKVRDELDLCWKVGNGVLCEFGKEYVSLFHFFRFPFS
jgi:tRNA-dihydrouridine synthase 3